MNINKLQDQTFDKVGIDFRKEVFNHGQLYIAFSRIRSWQALKVYLSNQRDNKHIKNYMNRIEIIYTSAYTNQEGDLIYRNT